MAGGPGLRITLAIGTLELGGAETQAVGLARALMARGHDVEVVLLGRRGGPLEEALATAGVAVHALGFEGVQFRDATGRFRPWRPIGDLVRFARMVRHLRARRTQVLHAYLFWSYATFVPVAWLARVPVRISARRGLYDSLPPYPFRNALGWLSTTLASAVVANARAVAEDARVNEGVPGHKLEVIHNGIDLPKDVADPGVEPPTAVIIANLIHYKGHLDLVQALARCRTPVVVRCFGEGPMRWQVEKAISDAGLVDRMVIEGRRPSAREVYAEAQFAILASHTEGMPNAVLEAMAAGLPVVATDVGGCGELVQHGVTGLLVPPRDVEALSSAIDRMAGDARFRASAGAAARARAARHSWEANADAHEVLYRRYLREDR